LRLLPVALGTPFFHPLALMNANKSVFGVNLGHMWHETDMIASWMEILLKGIADGWVRPHVDKSFPLAQAGEAQTYMEERRNIGKVILTT
jgi:synaptic vesicle membrane protein VAT-1